MFRAKNNRQIAVLRRYKGKFYFHEKPVNAKKAGNEQAVSHFSLVGSSERAAARDMIKNSISGNALFIDESKFVRVSGILGITTYQPMEIDSKDISDPDE